VIERTVAVDGGIATMRFTGKAEGDLGHGGRWVAVDAVDADVRARRGAVCEIPWSWLRQVHGDRVIDVAAPGMGAGENADGSVTTAPGAALVVLTADCAPVALVARDGVLGVVHAGWRGLVAGVVDRAVDEMRTRGATDITAVLGPCIHAECYEFGAADLDTVAARLGDAVRASTAQGEVALDVPHAVRAALAQVGVTDVTDVDICTACSLEHYSHRARGDRGRQALVLWKTSSFDS
jgi:YfiH family protein